MLGISLSRVLEPAAPSISATPTLHSTASGSSSRAPAPASLSYPDTTALAHRLAHTVTHSALLSDALDHQHALHPPASSHHSSHQHPHSKSSSHKIGPKFSTLTSTWKRSGAPFSMADLSLFPPAASSHPGAVPLTMYRSSDPPPGTGTTIRQGFSAGGTGKRDGSSKVAAAPTTYASHLTTTNTAPDGSVPTPSSSSSTSTSTSTSASSMTASEPIAIGETGPTSQQTNVTGNAATTAAIAPRSAAAAVADGRAATNAAANAAALAVREGARRWGINDTALPVINLAGPKIQPDIPSVLLYHPQVSFALSLPRSVLALLSTVVRCYEAIYLSLGE